MSFLLNCCDYYSTQPEHILVRDEELCMISIISIQNPPAGLIIDGTTSIFKLVWVPAVAVFLDSSF